MSTANTGAFTTPTQKVVVRDRLAHPVDELRDRNIEQKAAQQRPARKADDIRDDREQRQRDHEAEDARQHQQLIGIDARGIQRVDLLVELHGADLGGEGAARAARDDDGGQEHPELAQHADGDEIDHEDLRAEALQLLGAQVRETTLMRKAMSATIGIAVTPVS